MVKNPDIFLIKEITLKFWPFLSKKLSILLIRKIGSEEEIFRSGPCPSLENLVLNLKIKLKYKLKSDSHQ